MKGYLIDSSILVAILRGETQAQNLFEALDGEIVTSAICLAELYEGIFRSKKKAQSERALLTLLASLDSILPFGSAEAKLFGALKRELRNKPIPDMDLQIAATCIQYDFILVTRDIRHFTDIPKLVLHKEKN